MKESKNELYVLLQHRGLLFIFYVALKELKYCVKISLISECVCVNVMLVHLLPKFSAMKVAFVPLEAL